MKTITEQITEDLPISTAPAAAEVAARSGGKIIPSVADMYGVKVKDADKPRDPNTAVNEDQHELLADVQEIWNQVEQQGGIVPATMLYMHPWRMEATGPHCHGIEVPACPIEEEYIQFVQRSCRFDFGDRWGKFKVRPVWPIEIMRDFQRQHFSWQGGERAGGGIVVYMGDHLPGGSKAKVTGFFDRLASVIRKVSEAEVRKALEAAVEAERKQQLQRADDAGISDEEIFRLVKTAKEQQTVFYERSFEYAEQRATEKTKLGYASITPNHRMIAKWLYHRRRIAKLPPWVTETKPLDFVQKFCGKCAAEIDASKGYACAKCGRVYDGIRSWQDGNRDENTMLALRRHTREQLDAVGLNDIPTLEEEMKADAEGSAKGRRGKGKAEAGDKEQAKAD
jgi:hypothetical protein